jgi:hypothetical protein
VQSSKYQKKEKVMKKSFCFLALAAMLVLVGSAFAQEMIVDMIANKVIQKYQQSSCEQLWQQKSQPKSPKEQEIVQKLHANPGIRTEFINKVAAPIANKMFECGMIP